MEWKDIPGFNGDYQINRVGQVKMREKVLWNGRIMPEKIMSSKITQNGYKRIGLRENGTRRHYSIHRLIALTFIPNPQNKPQVNHKNGIKTDNRVDNLEWVTQAENMQHAMKIGTHKIQGPESKRAKLTWRQINEIKKLRRTGATLQAIGDRFKVTKGTIWKIMNNYTYRDGYRKQVI